MILVSRTREDGLNDLAGNVHRMVFLEMKTPRDICYYVGWSVKPRVCLVFVAIDLDLPFRRRLLGSCWTRSFWVLACQSEITIRDLLSRAAIEPYAPEEYQLLWPIRRAVGAPKPPTLLLRACLPRQAWAVVNLAVHMLVGVLLQLPHPTLSQKALSGALD